MSLKKSLKEFIEKSPPKDAEAFTLTGPMVVFQVFFYNQKKNKKPSIILMGDAKTDDDFHGSRFFPIVKILLASKDAKASGGEPITAGEIWKLRDCDVEKLQSVKRKAWEQAAQMNTSMKLEAAPPEDYIPVLENFKQKTFYFDMFKKKAERTMEERATFKAQSGIFDCRLDPEKLLENV